MEKTSNKSFKKCSRCKREKHPNDFEKFGKDHSTCNECRESRWTYFIPSIVLDPEAERQPFAWVYSNPENNKKRLKKI